MNAIVLFAEASGEGDLIKSSREAEDLSYWAGLSQGYQPDLRQWNPTISQSHTRGCQS